MENVLTDDLQRCHVKGRLVNCQEPYVALELQILKIEKRASFREAINSGRFAPVPLAKAYRLIAHGPTVLVSACHEGISNVMAAGWSCGLDFEPPKVTVVLNKITATRPLIVGSGYFALQVRSAALLQLFT